MIKFLKVLGLFIASIILIGVFVGYLEKFYVGIACGIAGFYTHIKIKGINYKSLFRYKPPPTKAVFFF